jgi:hypothetical protein
MDIGGDDDAVGNVLRNVSRHGRAKFAQAETGTFQKEGQEKNAKKMQLRFEARRIPPMTNKRPEIWRKRLFLREWR